MRYSSAMQHIDLAPPYRLVFGRHGPCLVNMQDVYVGSAIGNYGEYGEIELEFMQKLLRPGRDAVEVGANMGSHTVPLARALEPSGRRLLAVEPQPVVFQNMCANVALNRLLNVQAENCACADRTGWLNFDRQDYTASGNFGGVSMRAADSKQAAVQAGVQRVRSVPLDDLLDASWDVGFLKVDVEGFEQQVLEGARQTIARCQPYIYVENDRMEKSQALIEWLWSAGYKLWFHMPGLYNPQNFAGNTQNAYGNVVSVNMLAVPLDTQVDIGQPPLADSSYHPLARG
ncbi:MAG: FkbM family methyltransferase [Comamonadaceae bacterium]|nr:MAG: FkbM family methyltransferase [Comamonadaceae bacterium]